MLLMVSTVRTKPNLIFIGIVIFLNKTKQQNLKLELLILILSFIYKQNFKPYFFIRYRFSYPDFKSR